MIQQIKPTAAALAQVEIDYPTRTAAEKYRLAIAQQLIWDFADDLPVDDAGQQRTGQPGKTED